MKFDASTRGGRLVGYSGLWASTQSANASTRANKRLMRYGGRHARTDQSGGNGFRGHARAAHKVITVA